MSEAKDDMVDVPAVTLNIYQRINEVRKKISYLKKDATVTGYKAVTHDHVTASIRDHLVTFGIVIVPRQTSWETADTGKATSKGTPYTRFEGDYEFDVVNVDDPKDMFTGKVHAHAEDQGDKGPGKAISYALKAFELKLFNIESGEDDEERPEQELVKLSDEQIITLREMCEGYDWPVDETLERLAKTYGLTKIVDLPETHFKNCIARMEAQYAKQAEK